MPAGSRAMPAPSFACGAVRAAAYRASHNRVESGILRSLFWPIRPLLLPFIADRLRRAAGRRRAGHGVRADLEHLADQHGRAARRRVGRRAHRRDLHHRGFRDQPCRPRQRRLAAVRADRHSRRDRRRARRLCPDPGQRRRAKPIVLAYLDRARRSTCSIAASCTATPSAAQDRRAARPGRRLPRCGRRRRLGRDRHLQPAGPGQQPAQDHRHRQHRRILPDRDHLGDLHRRAGLGGVHHRHARPADRRRAARAVRRAGSPSASIPTRC